MDTDLKARVARLELENRRWRIAGAAAVLLLALGVLAAADRPDVLDSVRARGFQLVGPNGQERGAIALDEHGDAFVEVSGPNRTFIRIVAGDGLAMLYATGGGKDTAIASATKKRAAFTVVDDKQRMLFDSSNK